MDRYAVFGHPVAHSLSPRIHGCFAAQTGEVLSYEAIEAPLDGFREAVLRFLADGGRGCNVTLPFKGEAVAFADHPDPRAARAGAANTLRREADGRLSAYNTDGPGLVADLVHGHRLALADLRVVLLGAGGAAAGVIEALLDAGVGELIVANRTHERALALRARFATLDAAHRLRAVPLDALPAADLLVNATSASLAGQVPVLPDRVVVPGTFAYDMMYADVATPFLAWCTTRGAGRTADGLGMLVEQAAEAFLIWRGVRPDTAAVRDLLRPLRTESS
ncbi:MAG: shikimate dehydrogenase [Pseudomonadales bacterium]|nr:shikimate dehydrogenase [Pseudomonadales bacterium]